VLSLPATVNDRMQRVRIAVKEEGEDYSGLGAPGYGRPLKVQGHSGESDDVIKLVCDGLLENTGWV